MRGSRLLIELGWSPGFRTTVAEQTGADPDALLAEASERPDRRCGASAVPAQRRPRSRRRVAERHA